MPAILKAFGVFLGKPALLAALAFDGQTEQGVRGGESSLQLLGENARRP